MEFQVCFIDKGILIPRMTTNALNNISNYNSGVGGGALGNNITGSYNSSSGYKSLASTKIGKTARKVERSLEIEIFFS